MGGIYVISIVFTVIGFILSSRLRSKFNRYSQVPLNNGMNGAEIARTMLRSYGLHDVEIIQVDGQLISVMMFTTVAM